MHKHQPIYNDESLTETASIYLNQQWVDYTGVPLGELTGKEWTRFLHPDDAEETLQRWQHAVDSKESFELIHRSARRRHVPLAPEPGAPDAR